MAPYSEEFGAIQDAINIVNDLPASREKSLVMTKLEEAMLWFRVLEDKHGKTNKEQVMENSCTDCGAVGLHNCPGARDCLVDSEGGVAYVEGKYGLNS